MFSECDIFKKRRKSTGAKLRRLPFMMLVPWHCKQPRWLDGYLGGLLPCSSASSRHQQPTLLTRRERLPTSWGTQRPNAETHPALQLEYLLSYLSLSISPEILRLMTLQSLPKYSPLKIPLEDSPFPQPLPHDPVAGTVSPILIWNSSY